jgi:hypothetical protein
MKKTGFILFGRLHSDQQTNPALSSRVPGIFIKIPENIKGHIAGREALSGGGINSLFSIPELHMSLS